MKIQFIILIGKKGIGYEKDGESPFFVAFNVSVLRNKLNNWTYKYDYFDLNNRWDRNW